MLNPLDRRLFCSSCLAGLKIWFDKDLLHADMQHAFRPLKDLRIAKNEYLYFLAPAQIKQMQPIFLSCEAPFRNNLQINHYTHALLGRKCIYMPVPA